MALFWYIHSTVTMLVTIVSIKAEKVNNVINVQARMHSWWLKQLNKQQLNFNDLFKNV